LDESPRIDAHHHLWDLSVRDQPWITGEAFEPIRRSFSVADLTDAIAGRVDATVVVQTVSVPEQTRELLALAGGLVPSGRPSDPDGAAVTVAGVVGWVDLTAPDVADALAALDGPLVGIRHQVQDEPDPRWLCRDDVRRGLRAVGDAGLVYDLLTIPVQLPAAIETVRAFDDVVFVVDHLSKPPIAAGELEPWASQMRLLAACPNVVCKLSGMVTEADWQSWTVADLRPYSELVLDAFGPSRLMFGSDWPVCTLAASYAEVLSAAEALTASLSPSERAEIFGGTARRVYTLGLNGGAP
jgi:L-fuconolactonase